jgi:hypothetical protein
MRESRLLAGVMSEARGEGLMQCRVWWLDGVDEVDQCVGCFRVGGAAGESETMAVAFVCLALLAGDSELGFLDRVAFLVMGWARIGCVSLSGLGLAVS